MSKLKLDMSIKDSIIAMSEGNPGAINALIEIQSPIDNFKIDPENAFQGLSWLMHLDTLGIYGTDIHILYKYICNKSNLNVFTVLRAYQLGFLKGEILKDACHRQDRSGKKLIDIETLYQKVKEQLPSFNSNASNTMEVDNGF